MLYELRVKTLPSIHIIRHSIPVFRLVHFLGVAITQRAYTYTQKCHAQGVLIGLELP